MSTLDRFALAGMLLATIAWCLPRPKSRAGRATGPRLPLQLLASCLLTWATVSRRRAVLVTGALAAGLGAWAGGVVAAVVLSTYAGMATRHVLRRRSVRLARNERHRQLDGLSALAAELRAGARVPASLPPPTPPCDRAPDSADPDGATRIERLAGAAVRLAERTGAPLAELLERIESDARTLDRALAAAAAQAAGARATGVLLAGLPVGGLALGYAIGVDPLQVLLYTRAGAACALGAVVLQVLGLAWTERLAATLGRVA